MIEGEGWFAIRNKEGQLRYTRTGDFKFNGEGTIVNEKGDKLQGYLLDETCKPVTGGDSMMSAGTSGNMPNQT